MTININMKQTSLQSNSYIFVSFFLYEINISFQIISLFYFCIADFLVNNDAHIDL